MASTIADSLRTVDPQHVTLRTWTVRPIVARVGRGVTGSLAGGGVANRSGESRIGASGVLSRAPVSRRPVGLRPPTVRRPSRGERLRRRLCLIPATAPGACLLELDDDAVVSALDALHHRPGAPLRPPVAWLAAWRESHPDWSPWVLGLLNDTLTVRAAAPLALRERGGLLQMRFIGDDCALVWRTEADAIDLAQGLATALAAMHRPWSLELTQLPVGMAFTRLLAGELRAVGLRPGEGSPVVDLDEVRAARRPLSCNLRSAEAKARNRIRRAGLTLEAAWIDEPAAITRRMHEIRSVHRARDLQLRGVTLLDDRTESAYYDALVRHSLGQLELLELRLDGTLGAFVLWVRDGDARLVLDNRVAPSATLYSAGLIANNLALRRAASDPDTARLDWGPGIARYKLQSASRVLACETLSAWSSPRVRQALAVRRALTEGRRRWPRSTA